MVHYSADLPLILSGDASPYGVGAVLAHVMPDGREAPIAFGSRTLQAAEKNYSQLDKEALSIIFGIKKFNQFLSGRQFMIFTDHKPLLGLFNPSKPISNHISPRMLRWSLMLGAYQYNIKYREGKKHQNADALSRLPLNDISGHVPDIPEILYCGEGEIQFLITSHDIAKATGKDPVLSKVLWHIQRKDTDLSDKSDQFKPFSSRIRELSVHGKCLLWGTRVIIPDIFRSRLLGMLHEVHQGMSAMKSTARSYFWWPGLDKDIEMTAKSCEKCCQNSKHPPSAEAKSWPTTSRPWSRLHIDYAGPLLGTNFLIIVDAHSKWVEVKMTANTSSEKTIKLMRDVFATHGIPDTVVSDNGRNFVSGEFESFLESNGIRHIRTAPYHPSSNGQAERFVQTIKSHLKKMPSTNINRHLANILLRLRTTPNPASGESPAEILMGRKLRTIFDQIHPGNHKFSENSVGNEKLESTKRSRCFNTGDYVWFRNFGKGEKWLPGMVRTAGARNYEIEVNGEMQPRHIDQLRSRVPSPITSTDHQNVTPPTSVPPDPQQDREKEGNSNNTAAENILPDRLNEGATVAEPKQAATQSTRPQRQRDIPARLKDYLMGEEL